MTETLQALLGRRRLQRDRAPAGGPIRILMLNAFQGTGTERSVYNLAEHLTTKYDVRVVSLVRDRDAPFHPLPVRIALNVLDDRFHTATETTASRLLSRLPSVLMHPDDSAYKTYSLASDVAILRWLRGVRSGVLITTRPALNVFAARFARDDVMVIAQEHMNLSALKHALPAELARTYPRLDAVAVLTRSDEHDYRPLLTGSSTILARIPNAVPELPGEAPERRENIVVAAGRLVHQKGFDMLIEAWSRVALRHPDWTLQIYGGGKREEELSRLIKDRGLYGTACLAGPTQSMGEVMARGSIFALSSRYEGLPMVLLEAMSKGMAVVSFDCPTGPGEVLRHGRDGLLVSTGDIDAFSSALSDLIEDPESRARLGDAARVTAGSFSPAAIGGMWDELLRALGADGNTLDAARGA